MYPFLTRYRQNFGKINQEGSVKRCQDKVLRKLTTAAATTRLRTASYPDFFLLMKMCAQRKAGRRQRARRRFACRLYPSHGPLRFITSHSFRARLCDAKNEAPEEEADSDCVEKKNIWSNLERLPFVRKTRKFRGEFKWNGSSRWKFSGKKVMPFEVFPFSRFYWNDRNLLYHLFGLIVPGFMPRESENFAGILSTVQLNPVPVFGAIKIPVPFDGNLPPKFSCKW